jgi:predicted nucleic acid-binding protein
MNLVDSSGWLEYFGNKPGANFFAPAITNTDALIVPTISLFEVFKRVFLERGERAALEAAAVMMRGKVVELDAQIALNAAHLSAEMKLPLADSVILATARMYKATLWTQDADFKDIEGVQYLEKQP